MTTTLTRPAYRESPYVRYVVSQSVSVLGDQVWYVALSWAAVQQSTPAVAGVIVSVSALPRLLLMLFGGPLVDRYGPRRLMIGSDLLRVVVSVAAAGVALWQPTIALLVVVALVFGAVDAVFSCRPPARCSRGCCVPTSSRLAPPCASSLSEPR
ncbi:MFS transporter [Fodinicola feengrottensis]|uniref:MFS transporter n=1 Tax=Fodinicola feengrottensis TaxID=435914 RepID=UPI0013D556F2|nr:MFS transporter [Fodinicola feengrottensis]